MGITFEASIVAGRRGTLLGTCALILCCGQAWAQTVAQAQTAAQTDEEAAVDASGATQLGQIVVTATGFEQNVKDAPASITVVTREELERGSFRNLTDALREVQGVTVTGVANEKDIYIRGLPGQYTLILVDGKRQSTRDARTNGNAGFEQSFVPPLSAIERIEVVRGPMSSLYGSDAMGGVINIITRKVSAEWMGSITADATLQGDKKFGNYGQLSFYGAGPLIKDKVGLQVWGRGMRREEDAFLAGITGSEERDITGRLTFTPNEDHDILLEGGTTRVRREANPGQTLAETANGTYNHNDRDHWSITHTGRWGWTTSEFSLSQEWAERTNFTWTPKQSAFVENVRSPEIRNTVLDGKFITPFSAVGDHTLTVGGQVFDAKLTDQNPGKREGVDETFGALQWALFAEDEWQMTETFALHGGLRYDKHEFYDAQVSPRLYGVWNPLEQLTVKGGVSTGFRAPDIRSISPGYAYTTGGGGCSYEGGTCGVIIADPNLRAETSTSYEIGAIWDNYAGFTAGATYFYTTFTDKITNALVLDENGGYVRWEDDPNYRLWYNYNIDDAVIQGVELTASWNVTDTISLRGNYTYTHSRQKTGDFAGFPLARTPEHAGSLRADWITPFDGLQAWGLVTYHGEEIASGARIGSNGTPVVIDGKAGRKYDAYTTLDVGLSYTFGENDNVVLNGAVYNVFDKQQDATDFNTVGEGRRFWVSLTTNF
ncbi:TonB-dependent receptor domain-containing protein [Mesorhizobium sp. 1B3]|uniref:TonB-dependent receptor domain-containing protein n=1 Tax=Mesorhizobium sp. 1B3 TaxID=3243599 RepID=UPI003D960EED